MRRPSFQIISDAINAQAAVARTQVQPPAPSELRVSHRASLRDDIQLPVDDDTGTVGREDCEA